ncbi:MAG: FAD-dependent oxidoreductase [Clostridia bacterium]|nr:FAD-dependent oxidoreductase [Clostridia bacterium]
MIFLAKLSLTGKSANTLELEKLSSFISSRLSAAQQGLCPVDTGASFVKVCLSQSCGKCTPCRIGLKKLGEIYDRILDGEGSAEDIALIEKTARVIADSADCAIGYTAGEAALKSVLAFREDYESHINNNHCSAREEQPVPCSSLCPAQVDIPGYVALTAEGRYADAIRLIRKDNPFPSVCGLICEHPCEEGCRRGMVDDAVNIRGIKRFAAEKAGHVPAPECASKTGKHISVIGAGPSGLTAAYFLALMGHDVDVYEKRKYPGGMLRYGIPDYRLPEKILTDEINVILETGVKLHLDTDIGSDISFEELKKNSDAVYISIGAHSDKKLRIPGEDLEGVTSAVDLLRRIGDGDRPDFTGKKVAVVGGGNVAMDCARSSVRLGAESVSIVYRRRQEDMTALPEEVEGAIAEGCEVVSMMAPVSVEADESGKAKYLVVKPQIIGKIGRDGRPGVSAADLPEVKLEADIIIVAIGQAIESAKFGEYGLPLKWDTIAASAECDFEGFDGIFCGGDCATGPATVIKAIAAGKVAARNIDTYLGFNHEIVLDIDMPAPSLLDRPACGRVKMKERAADERKHDFTLMEHCMTDEEAAQECSRCLGCDHFGYGKFRGGRNFRW